MAWVLGMEGRRREKEREAEWVLGVRERKVRCETEWVTGLTFC